MLLENRVGIVTGGGMGMGEGQRMGVEHLARRLVAGRVGQRAGGAAAVECIAGEGAAEMFKMNADLVGAAGVQHGLHVGGGM